MRRRCSKAQSRSLVAACAGSFPGLAAIGAGLPLIGESAAGGFDREDGCSAGFDSRIRRLGRDCRGTAADRQRGRIRGQRLSAVAGHHAAEHIAVMRSGSGEAQSRSLVAACAGVLPGLAAVGAGLPLVGFRAYSSHL